HLVEGHPEGGREDDRGHDDPTDEDEPVAPSRLGLPSGVSLRRPAAADDGEGEHRGDEEEDRGGDPEEQPPEVFDAVRAGPGGAKHRGRTSTAGGCRGNDQCPCDAYARGRGAGSDTLQARAPLAGHLRIVSEPPYPATR